MSLDAVKIIRFHDYSAIGNAWLYRGIIRDQARALSQLGTVAIESRWQKHSDHWITIRQRALHFSRFTVAFTTERFVVVAYPLKRSQYNSRSRARYVILLLTLLAILLYSSSLWTSGIEFIESEGSNSSQYETRCVTLRQWLKFTRQMNLIDFFLTFIIPFFTIVTLNSLIIYKSGQYDRLLERNCTQPSTYVLQNLLEHRLRRFKYHRRITKMLLTISTTFLLLNTPMHLLKIYYFFFSTDETSDEKNSTESVIEMLTFYLFYTNFAINFFLYSLCGKNFRACLMSLIRRIGKRHRGNSLFSPVEENALIQYYQRSHASRHVSRFSKRELSSTLSSGGLNGHVYVSTSNIVATTGTSQHTLHPSSSASSFLRNSLKSDLLTSTKVKYYPPFTMKWTQQLDSMDFFRCIFPRTFDE